MLCLEPRRWVESKFWNKRKCECKVKTAATSDLKSNWLVSSFGFSSPHPPSSAPGAWVSWLWQSRWLQRYFHSDHNILLHSDQVYVFYPCQVFSTSVPALVTTSFATIYLMSMAAGKFQLEQNLLEGNSALEEFLTWTLRQLCRICWVAVFKK